MGLGQASAVKMSFLCLGLCFSLPHLHFCKREVMTVKGTAGAEKAEGNFFPLCFKK